MIIFTSEDTKIIISLKSSENSVFSRAVFLLRKFGCRYDKNSRSWSTSIYKFKKIKESLEEIDIISDRIDYSRINQIEEGTPEQETEPVRRLLDESLMTYPPIIGKHPYENFQRDGIVKGINRSRYLYGWSMGSGKSYVASAIIAHRLLKYRDCSKVVLVTSNIGVRNLKNELFKFIKNLDESKVQVITKDNRDFLDHKEIDIAIMSYNTFRLAFDFYKKKLNITAKNPRKPFMPFKEWSENKELMLILDESHEVSHVESQRSYAIALHARLFKYRYLFSGSVADKPEKLYNQLTILDPYLTYNLSYSDWKEKHAYIGTYFSPYAIKDWKKDELEKQNQRLLKAHGNYYNTRDLIDLPDYSEKRVYLTMSPKHREIYEAFVQNELKDKIGLSDIVNAFPYMQSSVDCPALLLNHSDKLSEDLLKEVRELKEKDIEKINALDDILEDHPKEKIVVWCIHPKTVDVLCERYKKLNPIMINGSIDQSERNHLLDEFREGDHHLLIANITTLSTSCTITCSHIQVYFERTYNYTDYFQSTARIYRIGQEKDVITYILIYKNSIDCFLDKNLSNKGALVSGLLKKEFLSQEEWIKIFNAREGDKFDY